MDERKLETGQKKQYTLLQYSNIIAGVEAMNTIHFLE
jgi:hypothetical protein